LTKLCRILISRENTSVTTYSEYAFHSFETEWNPKLGGYKPLICLFSALNWICWTHHTHTNKQKILAYPPPYKKKSWLCQWPTQTCVKMLHCR
jgi:hypothetical protein